MLPKDERWHLQANTVTTLWGISIRNKDGSYRTPKREELELLLEIYEAARVYGASEHTLDSNCYAGDCDDCSARPALAALEAIVGGPKRRGG